MRFPAAALALFVALAVSASAVNICVPSCAALHQKIQAAEAAAAPVPVVLAAPDDQRAFGEKIVNTAMKFNRKVSYVRAGRDPNTGFDCSGLVWYVFRQNGVELPTSENAPWSTQQYLAGTQVGSSDMIPGDLIYFDFLDGSEQNQHIGIYVGDDRFIHSSMSHGVIVSPLFSSTYWKPKYVGSSRIPAPKAA